MGSCTRCTGRVIVLCFSRNSRRIANKKSWKTSKNITDNEFYHTEGKTMIEKLKFFFIKKVSLSFRTFLVLKWYHFIIFAFRQAIKVRGLTWDWPRVSVFFYHQIHLFDLCISMYCTWCMHTTNILLVKSVTPLFFFVILARFFLGDRRITMKMNPIHSFLRKEQNRFWTLGILLSLNSVLSFFIS